MNIIPYAQAERFLKENAETWQMAMAQVPDDALSLLEARLWREAMGRCYNVADPKFIMFGGRSILMTPAWHVFSMFLAEVGYAPPDTVGLGRHNLDGLYEKGNVYWIRREDAEPLPRE